MKAAGEFVVVINKVDDYGPKFEDTTSSPRRVAHISRVGVTAYSQTREVSVSPLRQAYLKSACCRLHEGSELLEDQSWLQQSRNVLGPATRMWDSYEEARMFSAACMQCMSESSCFLERAQPPQLLRAELFREVHVKVSVGAKQELRQVLQRCHPAISCKERSAERPGRDPHACTFVTAIPTISR